MTLRTHIQTGGATLTAQQPLNNIARAGFQALASVLGGIQSMALSCYDEALALPTEEAQATALRTQQIIAHEIGATEVIDPLAGSYSVSYTHLDVYKRQARHMLQVSLAGTGVNISDGATTIMPIGPHRATKEKPLTPQQEAENLAVVHSAWKLHYDNVQHSLRHAYYQGWDLNPAQLPVRYAAVYTFFLESLDLSLIHI